jgi:hypothetical protein
MAEITDPVAIRFVNEQVRQLAEELRALNYRLESLANDWYVGVDATVPNSPSDVFVYAGQVDLSGADVHGLVASMLTAKAAIDGAAQLIEKAAVREPRAE